MRKTRPAPSYKRIAFVASDVPAAQRARRRLIERYGDARPEIADVVVALGGDGLMLRTLRQAMKARRPIYGMHRGTVGFLMNEFHEKGLRERLQAAQTTVIPSGPPNTATRSPRATKASAGARPQRGSLRRRPAAQGALRSA